MNQTPDTQLNVLAGQASGLIRAEVVAAEQRSKLELAAAQMVRDCGYTIDEVSAISGLTPTDIKRLLAEPKPITEVDILMGVN